MNQEEIQLAQEQLARLFGNYLEQIFEDGKNQDLSFVEFIEKPMYLAIMRHCKGNQSEKVKQLKISRATLRAKLLRHFDTAKVGVKFSEVA